MLNERLVQPTEVAGVRIPHTPLAIAAAEAAHASLPEVVTGHASRVFVFASLAARHEACACDADTLYVAAMYANMGLSAAYTHSTLRYEIDGADAARTFLQHHGAPSGVVGDIWYAIALHMTPGLPEHMSPLARVLSSAVRTDLFADNLGAYSQAECDQIVAAYPRGALFKERMIEAIGARPRASSVIDVRHGGRRRVGAPRSGFSPHELLRADSRLAMGGLVAAGPCQSNEQGEAMKLKQIAHGTSKAAHEE